MHGLLSLFCDNGPENPCTARVITSVFYDNDPLLVFVGCY